MADQPEQPASKRSRLWVWFVAAFVLQLSAWALWLTVASQYRVQEVPLATHSIRNPQSEVRN